MVSTGTTQVPISQKKKVEEVEEEEEKKKKKDLHLILKRQIRIHVTLLRLARIHRHRRPHHRHCASRHNRRCGSVQDTLNVLSILQRDHRFALDIEARGGAIFFGVDVERVVAGVRSAADEFVIDLPAWFDVHGLARFEGAGGGCETCEAQGEGEGGGGEGWHGCFFLGLKGVLFLFSRVGGVEDVEETMMMMMMDEDGEEDFCKVSLLVDIYRGSRI